MCGQVCTCVLYISAGSGTKTPISSHIYFNEMTQHWLHWRYIVTVNIVAVVTGDLCRIRTICSAKYAASKPICTPGQCNSYLDTGDRNRPCHLRFIRWGLYALIAVSKCSLTARASCPAGSQLFPGHSRKSHSPTVPWSSWRADWCCRWL